MQIRENFAATSWLQVDARILHAAPERGCGKGQSFSPLVRYEYEFDGASYVSEVLSRSIFDCGSYAGIKKKTDPYVAGQVVRAHVNPEFPAQAMLIAGRVDAYSKAGLGFFSGMAILCLYMALKALRARA